MGDKTRGIYHKFDVTRTDGSSAVGGKHENCFYFVLDCSHDPHAEAALKAYIASCRLEYPHLARNLECVLDECRFGQNSMVSSPVEPTEQLFRLRPLCICDNALTNQNTACPIHGSSEKASEFRPLCAHGNFADECPHPHTDVK